MRTIGSPTPCASFSGPASESVVPLTVTTVTGSWFALPPSSTVSPLEKPTAFTTLTVEAPIAAADEVLVLIAPGETAATGMTVQ